VSGRLITEPPAGEHCCRLMGTDQRVLNGDLGS
jgi:hypothetical protein